MTDFSGRQITIDGNILRILESVAAKNNIELDYLANHILRNYLEENTISGEVVFESRRFKRKKVIIPALIYEKLDKKGACRCLSATVLDISIGGLSLAVPIEVESEIEFLNNQTEFDVVLYLANTEILSHFRCQLTYVLKNEHTIKLGASFLECDEYSLQQLTVFLRQQQ